MTTFTISRNKLLAALLRCKHVINSKMLIPPYTCYLFSFEDGRLLVQGSDGVIFMQESLMVAEQENTENVSFALDKYYFLNAIKSLDEQSLRFEVMDYQVRVIHDCGTFWIPRDGAESILPDLIAKNNFEAWCKNCEPSVNSITFEIPGIKHWVNIASDSMADDYLRPAMNGVLLDFKSNNKLNVVASDGHQLTIIEKELEGAFDARLLIPRKVCNIISKCLPSTGMMDLRFTEYNYKLIETKSLNEERIQKSVATFTVQMDEDDPDHILFVRFRDEGMDSRYPNYSSVVPDKFNYYMTCDRKKTLKSINRMLQFANLSGMLRFQIEEDKVSITCSDSDSEIGADEQIPCTFTGQLRLGISFRGSTYASILKRITSENVRISYVDSLRPCIFEPEPQPGVENIRFLLMPMYGGD